MLFNSAWWSTMFLLINQRLFVDGSHFRGGIISWRPLNTTPSGSSVQILLRQRYSWRRSAFSPTCTNSMISSVGLLASGTGSLSCFSGTPSCSGFTTNSADVYCTDFSATTDYSSGERYYTYTLLAANTYIVGFYSSAWLALAMGGNGVWQVTNKIQLSTRPDGVINTSPVTSTLPVIYRTINTLHVHIVQMADADSTDTLRCRWATDNTPVNTNNWDECGSVCSPSLPNGFVLYPNNCTFTFTITALNYYAVALQIEDYFTSSSSTPMSSVPIQFLFYGTNAPTGCSIPPTIIGVRPNLACIGTPIGVLANETLIAQVGCPGKTITEFITSSPIGLIKSAIGNPSTGIYTMTLLFTPTASQFGPQGFCAGAIDNTNVQSESWCITFLVGFTAPNLQAPIFVQGSASPVGTIFANQTIFSIQSANGMAVNRPGHNDTYVRFNDATLNGTNVLSYDCGWSPNVIYSGSTIIIYAPYPWVPGHLYYVTFDSGASSGNDFCHAESAPITNPAFWQFDIWNPSLSSTTTPSTTTTTGTIPTVTTRTASVTTPMANLTTTGIIITTTSVVTLVPTITSTSITTATTATTATTLPTTSTVASVSALYPKDIEDACKQPIAIFTAVTMAAMAPLNAIGMFVLFSKMNTMFNPHQLMANQRQAQLSNRLTNKH